MITAIWAANTQSIDVDTAAADVARIRQLLSTHRHRRDDEVRRWLEAMEHHCADPSPARWWLIHEVYRPYAGWLPLDRPPSRSPAARFWSATDLYHPDPFVYDAIDRFTRETGWYWVRFWGHYQSETMAIAFDQDPLNGPYAVIRFPYPVPPAKDDLKAVGARWDERDKSWTLRLTPDAKAHLQAYGVPIPSEI